MAANEDAYGSVQLNSNDEMVEYSSDIDYHDVDYKRRFKKNGNRHSGK